METTRDYRDYTGILHVPLQEGVAYATGTKPTKMPPTPEYRSPSSCAQLKT